MAVSTTDTYSGPYAANGVTVEFPFTFKAVAVDDVAVVVRSPEGVNTPISSSAYDVTLADEGGSILFSTAPTGGDLYVLSEPSFLQSIIFEAGQAFLPSVVNQVNDRDVIRALYLKSLIDRAPTLPIGGGVEGKFAVALPGGGWGFASGTGGDAALREDLAESAGAALVAFAQDQIFANGSVGRKLQQFISPLDVPYNAVGNGVANDTLALLAADTVAAAVGFPLAIRTPLKVSTCTLSSHLVFEGAGRLIWGGTDTVTINGEITAPDTAGIFDFPNTATVVLGAKIRRVPMGWRYGTGTAAVGVSRFVNNAIASTANGVARSIVQTPGKHLIDSPIDIGQKQFISFRGPGPNFRSNIDYENSEGGSVEYPGGDGLLLARGCAQGIRVQASGIALFRISSLRISGMTFISSRYRTVVNTGVQVLNDSDALLVENSSFINFDLAGAFNGVDAARLKDVFVAECVAGFQSVGGKQLRIEGGFYGSQPGGIALDIANQEHLTMSGVSVFPDGHTLLKLSSVTSALISSTNFQSRFTGAIQILNGSNVRFVACKLKIYNLGNASWTDGKSAWSATNYDPQNRDLQFGALYLNGANDCDLSGLSIENYMPVNSCVVRNKAGNNNRYNNMAITGNASTKKFVNESGTGTELIYSVYAGEYSKDGGTLAFVARPAAA